MRSVSSVAPSPRTPLSPHSPPATGDQERFYNPLHANHTSKTQHILENFRNSYASYSDGHQVIYTCVNTRTCAQRGIFVRKRSLCLCAQLLLLTLFYFLSIFVYFLLCLTKLSGLLNFILRWSFLLSLQSSVHGQQLSLFQVLTQVRLFLGFLQQHARENCLAHKDDKLHL